MFVFPLLLAFAMGFTGSLHCAGMCGPVVWMMPFQLLNGYRKVAGIALYHLGRISMYAVLAWVFHSFSNLFAPRWQQAVSVGMGCMLLAWGLYTFLAPARNITLPWAGWVRKELGKRTLQNKLMPLFVAGSLNGLLPCGMVYMGISAAATAGSALQTMGMMYAFGLGTMPILVGISLLKRKLNLLKGTKWQLLVPAAIFMMGGMLVLRGMNLGIPYLSPKVMVADKTVKCCCHKEPAALTIKQ